MSWKLWDGMRRDGMSRDCGGCPSYCFFAVKTIINPLAFKAAGLAGLLVGGGPGVVVEGAIPRLGVG